MPRSCVFCGRPANSKEDAFPQWLSEVIPGEGVFRTDRGEDQWATKGFSVTVRQVCREHCNNGWMSDLETASRDVLIQLVRGENCRLDADAQRAVAVWGYKTALMVSLALRNSPVPQGHYETFYDTREPPEGTQVWLAAHAWGQRDVLQAGRLQPQRMEYATADGRPGELHGYRLTLNVAALVFHISYDPYGGTFIPHDVWLPIFPEPSPTLPWPPNLRITDQGLLSMGEGTITSG